MFIWINSNQTQKLAISDNQSVLNLGDLFKSNQMINSYLRYIKYYLTNYLF